MHFFLPTTTLSENLIGQRHTRARVIRLDVERFDLAILNDDGVALGSVASEDGGSVEGKVQGLCESSGGIGEETDRGGRFKVLSAEFKG